MARRRMYTRPAQQSAAPPQAMPMMNTGQMNYQIGPPMGGGGGGYQNQWMPQTGGMEQMPNQPMPRPNPTGQQAPLGKLNRRQRKRYNKMAKNQGQEAADAWRQQKQQQIGARQEQGKFGVAGNAPNAAGRKTPRRRFRRGRNLERTQGMINAQADFNRWNAYQQMAFNRPNESNPYGSLEYKVDENGNLVRETNLSQPQQNLLEQRQDTDYGLGMAAQNNLQQIMGQGQFNPQNLPQMPGAGGFDAERQRIEQELYGREAKILDERFGKESDQLRQSLADRGIPEGSELYNKELAEFDRRKNDAYQSARTGATAFGGQEQQSRFGMGMGARQQAYGEQMQQYQMPYQQMGQMLGMQAGIMNPQFQPMMGVNMPGVDVTGTALGMNQLASNERIAQQQMAMANSHSGGGGGYTNALPAPPPMAPTAGGSAPGFWEQAGAAAAGSFAQGAGQAAGNAIGSWFA